MSFRVTGIAIGVSALLIFGLSLFAQPKGEALTVKGEVVDLSRGQSTRALLVRFPCSQADQRASLPSMVAMLREMVDAAKASSMAVA